MRENKKIDSTQEGAILLNCNNIVKNSELSGSFFITLMVQPQLITFHIPI